MCGSMVDIQSATAEIRRGKKEDRKIEEETAGQKYRAAIKIDTAQMRCGLDDIPWSQF